MYEEQIMLWKKERSDLNQKVVDFSRAYEKFKNDGGSY